MAYWYCESSFFLAKIFKVLTSIYVIGMLKCAAMVMYYSLVVSDLGVSPKISTCSI